MSTFARIMGRRNAKDVKALKAANANLQVDKIDKFINGKQELIDFLDGNGIISVDDVITIQKDIGLLGSKSYSFTSSLEAGTYKLFIETDFVNVSNVWILSGYSGVTKVGEISANLYELSQSAFFYENSITFSSDIDKINVLSVLAVDGSYRIHLIKESLVEKCIEKKNQLFDILSAEKNNLLDILNPDIYIGNMDGTGRVTSQSQYNMILSVLELPAGDYTLNIDKEFDVVYNFLDGTNKVVSTFPTVVSLTETKRIRFMIRKVPNSPCTVDDWDNAAFSLTVAKNKNNFYRLPVTLELGTFYGDGANAPAAVDKIRVKGSLKTGIDDVLFIYIKNGYKLVINDIDPIDKAKKNFTLYNHCSYSSDNRLIRISAIKNDETEITDDFDEVLKVYRFHKRKSIENFDITIATSDSEWYHRTIADLVCDGVNDQFLIQCASYNMMKVQKVLLYPGNYYIAELRDNPNSTAGLFGHKVAFTQQFPIGSFRGVTHIEGYIRSYIQLETNYAVNIHFTQTLWDSIENTDKVSVIGGENRNWYPNRCVMHLKNINFRGRDAIKPVCFVDAYYIKNVMIENVNVMCREPGVTDYISTFDPFTYIPNKENVGFRGTQGSPYGNNHITRCLAWGCGVGYSIGGEHFILMDAGACFCGTGFAFSDYDGKTAMEHNLLMLKCVISKCMKSIVLNRYGFEEGVNVESLTEDELKKYNSTQELECIGLQLEATFDTQGLSADGYTDGSHPTEGIYEVHANGNWRGTVTAEEMAKPAKGCENIQLTVLKNRKSGTTSQRPDASYMPPNARYYDTDTNKEYIVYNETWREIGAAL